jgi:hypothetical protein
MFLLLTLLLIFTLKKPVRAQKFRRLNIPPALLQNTASHKQCGKIPGPVQAIGVLAPSKNPQKYWQNPDIVLPPKKRLS